MLRNVLAFTLVELLVVISIIVVLISLLAPSVEQAYALAIKAKCAANHHGLLTIFAQYASNNQYQWPSGKRDGDQGEHAIWVSTPFVQMVVQHTGNNKTQRAGDANTQWGIVPSMLVDPTMLDFGYRNATGWVIGYNYLGGHPSLSDANPDWDSPLNMQHRGELLACHNSWAGNGAWSVVAHTARGGAQGGDAPAGGYFYTGPEPKDSRDRNSEGAYIGYTDGSAVWKGIRELKQYESAASAGGSPWNFPAMW